jgi:heterotetrameric sarcosine oxidase gamma subunit
VADLIATPPLSHDPLTAGGVTLSVWDFGPMWSVAPYVGGYGPVGRWEDRGGARVVWTGRGQWFVMGDRPEGGAVTDQSDGWAGFRLAGPAAADVLMRLVALDLRVASFPVGSAARSGLNHMPLVLLREEGGFAMLTFRSMARTAWHEIAEAMARVEARARL